MNERIKKQLLTLGGANVKFEKSKAESKKKHKEVFIDTINRMDTMISNSEKVNEITSIILLGYEEPFWNLIEDLLCDRYGEQVATVMFWWLYEVIDIEEEDYYIHDEIADKQHPVKSLDDVYDVLKRLKLFKL